MLSKRTTELKMKEEKLPKLIWDSPPITYEYTLISQLRELKDAEETLIKKREEAKEKKLEIEKDWQIVENNKKILKSLIRDSHGEIVEHQNYALKANNKIKRGHEKLNTQQTSINETIKQISYLIEVKEKLTKKIEQHDKFLNFLNKVVEICPEFNSIGNILDRFQVFEDIRQQLYTETLEIIEFQHYLHQQLRKLSAEKSDKLQNHQNKLTILETKAEEAKMNSRKWQNIKQHMKNIIIEKTEMMAILNQGITEFYLSCCRYTGTCTNTEIERKEEIMFIKNTIQYYLEVWKLANDLNRISTATTKYKVCKVKNTYEDKNTLSIEQKFPTSIVPMKKKVATKCIFPVIKKVAINNVISKKQRVIFEPTISTKQKVAKKIIVPIKKES